MIRRWLINGVALAVLWLFVRGVPADPPIRLVEEGLIGLGVGWVTAYSLRRLYGEAVTARSLRVVPSALLYLAAFFKELLVANVEVARIVLSPNLDIQPDVVAVPLRVQNDAAITTIANSITLTPGTLTMDYDDDTNTLFVHSIDVDDPDALLETIRTWEDYALVIFDEQLKPGDPVPTRPVSDGGDVPVDGPPSDDQLGDDQPVDGPPSDDQSGDDQPVDGPPSDDQSGDDQPGGGRPADDRDPGGERDG